MILTVFTNAIIEYRQIKKSSLLSFTHSMYFLLLSTPPPLHTQCCLRRPHADIVFWLGLRAYGSVGAKQKIQIQENVEWI